MSLQFMDGCDHYANADILQKWDATNGTVAIDSATVPAALKATGQALKFSTGTALVRKMSLGAHATYIAAASFYVQAYPSDWELFAFLETTTQAQVVVRLGGSGNVIVYRGNEAVSLGSAANGSIPTGARCYVECKVVVHGSAGSVTIKVNGTTVLTLTGVNTQGGAGTTIAGVSVGNALGNGATGAMGPVWACDVLVMNGSGTLNNDFLGERRITTLYPSGAGTYTQWTPNTGANYAAVDDAQPNGDTDYVAAAAVGTLDTYAFGDLPVNTTLVSGVQFVLSARKDDTAARTVQVHQKNGASEADGTAGANLSTTYAQQRLMAETSLITGSAWTPSEVNASEFGVKVAS